MIIYYYNCLAIGLSQIISSLLATYLEEQDEANPLIVGVVFLGRFIVKVVAYTGMRHFYSDLEINKAILIIHLDEFPCKQFILGGPVASAYK